MKKLLALSVAMATLNFACADIIELDMQNADICRKQILSAKTDTVVIVDYDPGCGAWQYFEPGYENVAVKKEYLEKYTFFKAQQWNATDEVRSKCLQETGLSASPRTKIIGKRYSTKAKTVIIDNADLVVTGAMNQELLERLLNGQIFTAANNEAIGKAPICHPVK